MDNTTTYKYYRFPNKSYMPVLWPDNVDVSEIGFIQKKEDIERGFIDRSWYVNAVCYENVNLQHLKYFEIDVKTPRRVWFGQ